MNHLRAAWHRRIEAALPEDRYGTKANVVGHPSANCVVHYNRDTDTLIFVPLVERKSLGDWVPESLVPEGGFTYSKPEGAIFGPIGLGNGWSLRIENGEIGVEGGGAMPTSPTMFNPLGIEALERLLDTFPEMGRYRIYQGTIGYSTSLGTARQWLTDVNDMRSGFTEASSRRYAQDRSSSGVDLDADAPGSCSCGTGSDTPLGGGPRIGRRIDTSRIEHDPSCHHHGGGQSPRPAGQRSHTASIVHQGLRWLEGEPLAPEHEFDQSDMAGTGVGVRPYTASQPERLLEASRRHMPDIVSSTETIRREAWSQVCLFHGTIWAYAEGILREGLKPRDTTGNENHWRSSDDPNKAISRPGMVYLSHPSRLTVSRSAMTKIKSIWIEREYAAEKKAHDDAWKAVQSKWWSAPKEDDPRAAEYKADWARVHAMGAATQAKIDADERLDPVLLRVCIPREGWKHLRADEDTEPYSKATTDMTGMPEWMGSIGSDAVIAYEGTIPPSWITVAARGDAALSAGMSGQPLLR